MLSVALHDSPGAGTAVPTQRAHAVERQWHAPEGFWHSGLNNRAHSGLWLQNIIGRPPCARGRAGCTPAACTGPSQHDLVHRLSCRSGPAAAQRRVPPLSASILESMETWLCVPEHQETQNRVLLLSPALLRWGPCPSSVAAPSRRGAAPPPHTHTGRGSCATKDEPNIREGS